METKFTDFALFAIISILAIVLPFLWVHYERKRLRAKYREIDEADSALREVATQEQT